VDVKPIDWDTTLKQAGTYGAVSLMFLPFAGLARGNARVSQELSGKTPVMTATEHAVDPRTPAWAQMRDAVDVDVPEIAARLRQPNAAGYEVVKRPEGTYVIESDGSVRAIYANEEARTAEGLPVRTEWQRARRDGPLLRRTDYWSDRTRTEHDFQTGSSEYLFPDGAYMRFALGNRYGTFGGVRNIEFPADRGSGASVLPAALKPDAEFVIIGGGPQGVAHAANIAARIGSENITVIDPHPELMSRWTRFTSRVGMHHLRSPEAHSLTEGRLSRFAASERGLPHADFLTVESREGFTIQRPSLALLTNRAGP
jgi:hypothetical protein